uniref:Uncharacterized protein MANES_09G141300 n=1 Tax=Rhizophora mucronata TaxID=61149 RepID=A0A2P2IWN6_RHIMU
MISKITSYFPLTQDGFVIATPQMEDILKSYPKSNTDTRSLGIPILPFQTRKWKVKSLQ